MSAVDAYQEVCIVGCGLIGGSFALALRRAGFTGRLTAYNGRRPPSSAVSRGVVDAVEESFDRGQICRADLIYLAAPIGGIIDFLRTRGRQIKPQALVTDAGSTKVEITRVARESLPESVDFIGGHPMAGSEQTGVEYSRGDLFDGATYALTIDNETAESQSSRLKLLIEATGARVMTTSAEAHDAAAALISHLPQLTASALASLLSPESAGELAKLELAQRLAAAGWRDMTRLAGSSWGVWRDICMTNQPNISIALGDLIDQLQSLKDALDSRDFNRVRELFATGNDSVAALRALHYQRFKNRQD